MKLTIEELRRIIEQELNEAKKKEKKEDVPVTDKMEKSDVLDYSTPLGDKNLYKKQGVSNLGPYTSENALRLFVKECIQRVLSEKKIGFKKLKNILSKKKGVDDPAALAASIGRKKYGNKAMAKKAAAGKKKAK